MKKYLLATAILVASASLANANELKVTVGGNMDVQAGVRDQKSNYNYSTPTTVDYTNGKRTAVANPSDKVQKSALTNNTKLDIKVDAKSDNGLEYGALVRLNADTSSTTKTGNGNNAEKAYVHVGGMFGKVEAGNTEGVSDTMKVDASNVARATGGINGDWKYWANPNTSIVTTNNGATSLDNVVESQLAAGKFIVAPALPSAYDPAFRKNATKINYYTPKVSGFQAGVTYIPDLDSTGSINGVASRYNAVNTTYYRAASTNNVVAYDSTVNPTTRVNSGNFAQGTGYTNIFTGGLSYETQVDQFGVKLSAVGEIGDAKKSVIKTTNAVDSTFKNLRAYNVGGAVTFTGVTVAGSYGSWEKSGAAKNVDDVKTSRSDYWTAGAAYEFGPFGTSVTYLQSSKSNGYDDVKANVFKNWSIGADYKLAPGLLPYAEVSFFEYKEGQNRDAANAYKSQNNKGTIALIGTKLSF